MSVAESIETRPSASVRLRASLGQRGLAFALALFVELLVALLLWFLAPTIPGKDKGKVPAVFGIEGPSGEREAADRKEAKTQERKAASGKPKPAPPKPVEPDVGALPSMLRPRQPSTPLAQSNPKGEIFSTMGPAKNRMQVAQRPSTAAL